MDIHALGEVAANEQPLERKVVPSRVLHADADFFCYECAHLDESLNENIKAVERQVDYKRRLVGAEKVYVHVTLGLKGGREQFATVKQYQEKRGTVRSEELKERVLALRTHLANWKTDRVIPVPNLYQEADDSLSQYHLQHTKELGEDLSILMSSDKDLWMVDGTHADPKTGEFYHVSGYGKTEYKEVGNVKPKLVGRGKSWFWYQMVQGDTADNIPGLPMLTGRLANKYVPTKSYNPKRKAIKCGEAKAHAMLKDVTNDKEAARRVYEAYREFYGNYAEERMLEQGFLLWMRRTPRVLDVIEYFRECGLMIKPSKDQVKALEVFAKLVTLQKEKSDQ